MKPLDLHRCLNPFLRPFSLPYALAMRARRALYENNRLARFTSACPCVSVGNIAWGGTGKTPFTGWLLDWARRQGVRAVVLSRGYGGEPGKIPLLVRADTPAHMSGDEPLLLARSHPEASVVAFPRRAAAARFAEETLSPDLFILDDGMQHLAMNRQANIILLRPQDLTHEWNRVIPSGSWREGPSALASASVFAVKIRAEDFPGLVQPALSRLAAFGRPLFSFDLVPSGLCPLFPKEGVCDGALSSEDRRDTPYILVSGVGNPQQVEQSACDFMGRKPLQHFAFDDHHPYSAADVQAIAKLSAAPLPVVCTGKDAVKLREFANLWENTPVWVLETTVRFGPALFTGAPSSPATFPLWWDNWWRTRRAGPPIPEHFHDQQHSRPYAGPGPHE